MIDGIEPDHSQISIEEAEISLPLIVQMVTGHDGPVFLARPPYSAFKSGVMPVAHFIKIRLEQTVRQTAAPLTQLSLEPAE